MIGEQAGLAVSQIDGEKEAAARDEIAPIVGHRCMVSNL
jgi:hypothetical protein